MPQVEIYSSSNGDSWYLCRNEAGHVYVVHEPNKASGGKAAAIGLGEFLSQASTGPEHETLLRMIGGLTDHKNS
jgi:hypothetical protein